MLPHTGGFSCENCNKEGGEFWFCGIDREANSLGGVCQVGVPEDDDNEDTDDDDINVECDGEVGNLCMFSQLLIERINRSDGRGSMLSFLPKNHWTWSAQLPMRARSTVLRVRRGGRSVFRKPRIKRHNFHGSYCYEFHGASGVRRTPCAFC